MARPFQKEQELFRLIVMHNKLMTAEDLEYFYQDTPDPEEAIKRIVGMGHFDEKTAGKLLKLYHANLAKIKKKEPEQASESEPESSEGADDLSPEEEARLRGQASEAAAQKAPDAEPEAQPETVSENSENSENPEDPEDHASQVETAQAFKPSTADAAPVAKAELPPEKPVDAPPSSDEDEDGDDGIPVPGFRLDFKPKKSAFTPEPPLPDQVIGPKLKIGDGGQRFLLNLIKLARRLGATDLHIKANAPAWLRVNGQLKRLNMEPLPADIAEKAMLSLLLQKQINQFKKNRSLSTYYATEGEVGRIRLEIWRQYHGTECVIRLHQPEPIAMSEVAGQDFSRLAEEMSQLTSGLFVIAGGKSSGKTSAAYSLLQHALKTYQWRALTLEAPVEQVFQVEPWQITQRDRSLNVKNSDDLIRMLRVQRYDVLFLGQLTHESDIKRALNAAESGCRVLTTMPQLTASDCASRLIRAQVLSGLSAQIALQRVYCELKSVTQLQRAMNADEKVLTVSQTIYPYSGTPMNGELSLQSYLKKINDMEAALGSDAIDSKVTADGLSVI